MNTSVGTTAVKGRSHQLKQQQQAQVELVLAVCANALDKIEKLQYSKIIGTPLTFKKNLS